MDCTGVEVELFAEALRHTKPTHILVDAPRCFNVDALGRLLLDAGYTHKSVEVLTSQLGAAVAKTKFVIFAKRGPGSSPDWWPESPRICPAPGRMKDSLLPLATTDEECWVPDDYQVTWDPRMATTGNRYLPRPVGYAKRGRD